MLKALELVGFKSFADKTRFEFPSGITAVVGPNGSGKSNVVDAIKWVLGEQSAKSLRGKEMADVIFNGSATRKPVNSAEVTLSFNNEQRILEVDADEVHVTRRVYRSGEGEYLINRQPARLRDIKDLFAGTGVASHGYSVIEQGKVAAMLDASPQERRMIFEEAAGISRFRSKKQETIRRMERVEQNLQRLSDIVAEVESRLKTLRLQAAKARRYQEYTARLQSLRTQIGLADYRALSDRLQTLDDESAQRRAAAESLSRAADEHEGRARELEADAANLVTHARDVEASLAQHREQIVAVESAIDSQRARSRELEEELARHRRRLAAMSVRSGDLQQQFATANEQVREAEDHHRRLDERLAADQRAVDELAAGLQSVRAESERRRQEYVEAMRQAAIVGNEITGYEAQVATAEATRQRSERRLAELEEQLRVAATELSALEEEELRLKRAADERREDLAEAERELVRCRDTAQAAALELQQLRQRHTGAAERASLLEELEKRLEGLSTGVKEVLLRAKSADPGPFREVYGLVADLFQVNLDTAPLVEAALGETAGFLVVAGGDELRNFLSTDQSRFGGRVGFVPIQSSSSAHSQPAEVNLEGRPGVVGRADRFVEAQMQFVPLVRRLLGRTWIVQKLSHALALAAGSGAGQSFVTMAGELLRPDGTMVVGPRHTATGLISRRSELRALKQQVADLAQRIETATARVQECETRICEQQTQVEDALAASRRAGDTLAEMRIAVRAADARKVQLVEQRTTQQAEREAALKQIDTAGTELEARRTRRAESEATQQSLELEIATDRGEIERLATEHAQALGQLTASKVDRAKSEERLGNLQAQLAQIARDQQERTRAMQEHRHQIRQTSEREAELVRSLLAATSRLAWLYLKKESLAAEAADATLRRDALTAARQGELSAAQRARATLRGSEEELHAAELAASEVRLQRNNLVSRLQEDYGVDLAALEHEPTDDELRERAEVDQEISDLRRKINNIGNVNLEALGELDELESRFANLSAQYADLASAKDALEKIIAKINVDSRRLFADTLQVVTGHFKDLFRKLFGGGHGDIVLDDGADILETGIEIVACPPGKEPRNISLLSGGEKTLTCVALLMAIFRSRPSPFCVLDEVDAALDEANIERFIHVLKDFVNWTQFIVVTHSKKSMTCADTLYGVTMQESGISKRVSVRFDDVSEGGEIRAGAVEDEAAA